MHRAKLREELCLEEKNKKGKQIFNVGNKQCELVHTEHTVIWGGNSLIRDYEEIKKMPRMFFNLNKKAV